MAPLPHERTPRTCLVVPCYNEQARLDVPAFEKFIALVEDVSFVFVNDGSKDATLEILLALQQKYPEQVRALDVQPNQGKAEAVRRGMLLAMSDQNFDYAGFWDADLATPLNALELFVDVLERIPTVDMVFGTRVALLGRNIERKLSRHYLGRVFATGASIVLSLPVYDTQCGAKLFRVNEQCRALFDEPFGSRWIFDIEVVARYCLERSGLAGIYEQPLDQWRDVGESKVRPVDFIRAIGELVIIYRTYSRPGNRHWLLALLTAPFVRYALAGAVGTLFYYLALTVAVEALGMSPASGVLVGAPVGALINYVLNYHLVFASKRPHYVTLPRFVIVAALGVLLSRVLFRLTAERVQMHYLATSLLATGIFLILGFLINRHWTFARRE